MISNKNMRSRKNNTTPARKTIRNKRRNIPMPRYYHRVQTRIPGTLGFPDTYICKLKYAEAFSINPGSISGQYTYRANSLFDPDFTSGGHQPHYYDQLSAIYTRYRVYGIRFEVSIMNNAGTSPVQGVIIPNTEVFTVLSLNRALEHPRAVRLPLLGVAGINTATSVFKMSTSTFLGLKPREILDKDYSAGIAENPQQIWYIIFFVADVNSTNCNVSVVVNIEYLAEFYDRVEVAESLDKEQSHLEEQMRRKQTRTDPVGPVTQVQIIDQPIQVALQTRR